VAETPDGPRRLLVVSPDFPPSQGGIQRLLLRLVELMPRFETRVVAREAPGSSEWDAASALDVRRAPPVLGSNRAALLRLNAIAVSELRRFRPDVVLAGHVWAGSTVVLARARWRVPSVLYLHADEVTAHPALSRVALRASEASVAVSRHTRGLALRYGADPERIRLIPPGVDVPNGAAPERDPSASPTVVTVARLEDRYKGHDVLLRSVALMKERLPSVRWLVVGDGPLRPELERLAARLGVAEHVHFLGAVSDAERDAVLRRADVFAMPSRLPRSGGGEGFGIAYLEAASHGTPVVAGNVAGALDAVVDGETGFLVDPEDPGAVAEALVRLLTDPALARRMGEAGAARARDFSWRAVARRVEAVLVEVARAASGHGGAGRA
jgi:phosphatidyl-myo-inositol dimannoside synthase